MPPRIRSHLLHRRRRPDLNNSTGQLHLPNKGAVLCPLHRWHRPSITLQDQGRAMDKILNLFNCQLAPSLFRLSPVSHRKLCHLIRDNLLLTAKKFVLAAVGQVQQLVSGGQVLQILSGPPGSAPQVAGPNATSPAVRHSVAAARSKQPQLRPKPANNSSPGPAQQNQSVK